MSRSPVGPTNDASCPRLGAVGADGGGRRRSGVEDCFNPIRLARFVRGFATRIPDPTNDASCARLGVLTVDSLVHCNVSWDVS